MLRVIPLLGLLCFAAGPAVAEGFVLVKGGVLRPGLRLDPCERAAQSERKLQPRALRSRAPRPPVAGVVSF